MDKNLERIKTAIEETKNRVVESDCGNIGKVIGYCTPKTRMGKDDEFARSFLLVGLNDTNEWEGLWTYDESLGLGNIHLLEGVSETDAPMGVEPAYIDELNIIE